MTEPQARKSIEIDLNQTDKTNAERLIIRQVAFPQEYPAVLDLWANAGPGIHIRRSDQPGEMAKKIARDPDLFLAAELFGTLIGTVLGGFDGRRGMIYHLAVAEEYRRLGVGSRLMEELETRLRIKGCIRYYLLVTMDNFEAMRFYEKHGCERMELYAYGKDIA